MSSEGTAVVDTLPARDMRGHNGRWNLLQLAHDMAELRRDTTAAVVHSQQNTPHRNPRRPRPPKFVAVNLLDNTESPSEIRRGSQYGEL